MRYALVSDLHANLQAWNAVLLDIRSLRVDAIVALGDLVGYGPNPAEVLKSAYANINHFVLGNHDAVICGKLSPALFNETARELILWTRKQLGTQALSFLRTLPLSLDGGSFRCAHGDFSQPAAFHYIIEPSDALASWQAVDDALLFVGHTHQPAIHLLGPSGTPRGVAAQDFELEPEKRFLVNVGSVGQPRDGDARAGYCIYDADRGTVVWRRVPFDLDAYRDALQRAGLPPDGSYFLRHDPRLGVPPLRDLLSFSPARSAAEAATDAVEVQELKALKRTVIRWRRLAALALLLLLGGGGLTAAVWWRQATRRLVLVHPETPPGLDARRGDVDANLLPGPQAASPYGVPIRGWEVAVSDKRRQSVAVRLEAGQPLFALESRGTREEIRLSSPAIYIGPDTRVTMSGLFRKSPDFDGTVALVLSVTRRVGARTETLEEYLVKEPNAKRGTGWEARVSKDLPAGAVSMRLHLRGRFSGRVTVSEISLTRKK